MPAKKQSSTSCPHCISKLCQALFISIVPYDTQYLNQLHRPTAAAVPNLAQAFQKEKEKRPPQRSYDIRTKMEERQIPSPWTVGGAKAAKGGN